MSTLIAPHPPPLETLLCQINQENLTVCRQGLRPTLLNPPRLINFSLIMPGCQSLHNSITCGWKVNQSNFILDWYWAIIKLKYFFPTWLKLVHPPIDKKESQLNSSPFDFVAWPIAYTACGCYVLWITPWVAIQLLLVRRHFGSHDGRLFLLLQGLSKGFTVKRHLMATHKFLILKWNK